MPRRPEDESEHLPPDDDEDETGEETEKKHEHDPDFVGPPHEPPPEK